MNMKTLTAGFLLSFMAPAVLADSGHMSQRHERMESAGQPGVMPGTMMEHIEQMNALVERLASAPDAHARDELLQQHTQMMEQMRGFMGGGMMGDAGHMHQMMGHKGEHCPLHQSMEQTIEQMDKRMDLMQQMIERLAAEKGN